MTRSWSPRDEPEPRRPLASDEKVHLFLCLYVLGLGLAALVVMT